MPLKAKVNSISKKSDRFTCNGVEGDLDFSLWFCWIQYILKVLAPLFTVLSKRTYKDPSRSLNNGNHHHHLECFPGASCVLGTISSPAQTSSHYQITMHYCFHHGYCLQYEDERTGVQSGCLDPDQTLVSSNPRKARLSRGPAAGHNCDCTAQPACF